RNRKRIPTRKRRHRTREVAAGDGQLSCGAGAPDRNRKGTPAGWRTVALLVERGIHGRGPTLFGDHAEVLPTGVRRGTDQGAERPLRLCPAAWRDQQGGGGSGREPTPLPSGTLGLWS